MTLEMKGIRAKMFHTFSEAYTEASRTSKMECFTKLGNCWKPLIVYAKTSTSDVWQGSEYTSAISSLKRSSFDATQLKQSPGAVL